MKDYKNRFITPLLVIITLLVIIFGAYFYSRNKEVVQVNNEDTLIATTTTPELISLTLYIQNKEVARTSDCSVTQKVIYQVPRTSAVADASLKILFEQELAQYGTYESVSISNGVAIVRLQSDMTPAGYPIGGLSSCQSSHLMSVLRDTLTQYESIKSVELYSPKGKIIF